MYDKYFQGNTFAVTGAKLPKHKGVLFTTTSNAGATCYLLNYTGNTFAVNFAYAANTTNILPIQVYGVAAMGTGMTGFWLS